jgi:malonyl-CoA decarboxylase
VSPALARLGAALLKKFKSSPPKPEQAGEESNLKDTLLALAAYYFLEAKGLDGRPLDAVARFHLGNGARLERLNFMADASDKSLREALGLMVNYRYDLKEIERNHEAFANEGVVAASRAVRGLLKPLAKAKPAIAQAPPAPALPPPLPAKTPS